MGERSCLHMGSLQPHGPGAALKCVVVSFSPSPFSPASCWELAVCVQTTTTAVPHTPPKKPNLDCYPGLTKHKPHHRKHRAGSSPLNHSFSFAHARTYSDKKPTKADFAFRVFFCPPKLQRNKEKNPGGKSSPLGLP